MYYDLSLFRDVKAGNILLATDGTVQLAGKLFRILYLFFFSPTVTLPGATRTRNKLNPHMASIPGFKPGPHCCEASVLSSVPSLLPQKGVHWGPMDVYFLKKFMENAPNIFVKKQHCHHYASSFVTVIIIVILI